MCQCVGVWGGDTESLTSCFRPEGGAPKEMPPVRMHEAKGYGPTSIHAQIQASDSAL